LDRRRPEPQDLASRARRPSGAIDDDIARIRGNALRGRRIRQTMQRHQSVEGALDAGAKIVLGAHPHVLGPVTRPTAATLVAWSLGNFVFPSSGVTARTAILRVNVDRRGARGYRLLPVAIEGFRPRLVLP